LAHARFGEGTEAAKEWVTARQTELKADQIEAVLAAIAAWKPKSAAKLCDGCLTALILHRTPFCRGKKEFSPRRANLPVRIESRSAALSPRRRPTDAPLARMPAVPGGTVMEPKINPPSCPDCDGITRRDLLKTVGGVAIAAATMPLSVLVTPRPVSAAEAAKRAARSAKPETLVKTLYDSMTAEQKSAVAFPFDHALRSRVDANWAIVRPSIKEFFTPDQQAMITDIFHGVHSEEYLEKVLHHINEDDPGGLGNYHVALFGTPGTGKFEWVLTGRHCTIRCDGDSVEGAAFGGPIFYGHAAGTFNEKPDHPGNVYWYQAKRANEVFQALDGKQREVALVKGDAPPERSNDTVKLSGKDATRPGIPVSALARDQRALVEKVMADLLLPFRKADADEAMRCIRENGGVNSLSLAFYQSMDIGNDGVWDVWRLEGPAMVWYFRGSPHVHTWVNVARKAG
jgi:hypothetical protein